MMIPCISSRLGMLLLLLTMFDVGHGMRHASPLQVFTIWDEMEHPEISKVRLTPRELYLRKRQAALEAELKVEAQCEEEHDEWLQQQKAQQEKEEEERQRRQQQATTETSTATAIRNQANKLWARRVQKRNLSMRRRQEILKEKAYDEAVARVERAYQTQLEAAQAKYGTNEPKKNPNKYQFVGVVSDPSFSPPNDDDDDTKPAHIAWYARKKPKNARWTMRLIHVNRAAIIQDLFQQGKLDLVAKYQNKGIMVPAVPSSSDAPGGRQAQIGKVAFVEPEYRVKERSWRNLWNFSPKHFFTDSSGAFWRERRLRPGIYTDGNRVYESTYRYTDGRNGMKDISSLNEFFDVADLDEAGRLEIQQALKERTPDIILEE